MRILPSLLRAVAGTFLILHGLVHSMGFLGAWDVVTMDDLSRSPILLLDDPSASLARSLGLLWLAAGMSFVVAGIALLRGARWWASSVIVASLLSLLVTSLWIADAMAGLTIDLAALLGVLGWVGWAARHGRRPVAPSPLP